MIGFPVLLALGAATLWLGSTSVSVPAWAPWLMLFAWIGVLIGGTWRLLRPVSLRHRVLVYGVLLLLLLGMILPPESLQAAQQWLADRFGRIPGNDKGAWAPMLAHVGLYAAFAGSLLWARGDRHPVWVLLALAGVAVATELMQLLVDGRNADPVDVLLNFTGIGLAAAGAWLFARVPELRRFRLG